MCYVIKHCQVTSYGPTLIETLIDSVQPTRAPMSPGSPGRNTGVGSHFPSCENEVNFWSVQLI